MHKKSCTLTVQVSWRLSFNELMWSLYLKDGLEKGCFSVTLEKILHIHYSGLAGDRAHCVNVIGLLQRWSCKGCSSLTQGSLHTFIQVSWEKEPKSADTGEASVCLFSGLPGERAPWVNMTVFLRGWSCIGYLLQWTVEKSAHLVRSPGRQNFRLVTLGKPLHINYSGLLRESLSSQYDRLI